MRREWDPEDLIACWTLVNDDWSLVGNKTGATRVGFVALLKFFELEARFPRHGGEVPRAAVDYLGQASKRGSFTAQRPGADQLARRAAGAAMELDQLTTLMEEELPRDVAAKLVADRSRYLASLSKAEARALVERVVAAG